MCFIYYTCPTVSSVNIHSHRLYSIHLSNHHSAQSTATWFSHLAHSPFPASKINNLCPHCQFTSATDLEREMKTTKLRAEKVLRTISNEQSGGRKRGTYVQIDWKRNRAVTQEEVQYSDDETKDTHNNLVLRSKRYDYSAAATSTTHSLLKEVEEESAAICSSPSMHVARGVA